MKGETMNTNFWDFAISLAVVSGVLLVIAEVNEIRKEIVEEKKQ